MIDLRKYHKYNEILGKRDLSDEEKKEILSDFTYNPVDWLDHIAQTADVKKETVMAEFPDGSKSVRHERDDGEIFQKGKPINEKNLGNMDFAILKLFLKIFEMESELRKLGVLVSTLLGQNQNNMPYNTFVLSALDQFEGLKIIEGWYEEANGRGVV
ncbi:hypothetical protein [Peptoniphilus senegalensis]|uniref:Uncharacterized protein n=1 Tax=Peptoniphilus senegalensis TaxID=1465757 RepID=A0ABV1J4L4_9FIRM